MRIAVIGERGQLALSMAERGPIAGHEIFPIGRPALDLAASEEADISVALRPVSPDVIVNAAAYTAVDRAESEPEVAFAVNAEGAGAVGRAAAHMGIPLVHLSTDYVFAGDKREPYIESDPEGPIGVYGASKLAGEEAVLASGADAALLRTAWVYSPFSANFVKTMLRLAETRDEIAVVADQHGNPTSALDLADAVIGVAEHLYGGQDPAHRGIFHVAGSGEGSWADLADAVFATSKALGGASAVVNRITTADYPTNARRPANSRLDCAKLRTCHGISLSDWRVSVAAVTARLLSEGPSCA